MDIYVYDPSVYYGAEDESPSSADPPIRFEFGAYASAPQSSSGAASSAADVNMAAPHSSAQAQTIESEDPVQDVNIQAKLLVGISVTIFIVTVHIEALRPFYKA
jgi:hypothetical protein